MSVSASRVSAQPNAPTNVLPATLAIDSLESEYASAPVPIYSLRPGGKHADLPLILYLHGGGASGEQLKAFQPQVETAWDSGELPPCVLVTPTTGEMSWYHEHDDGSERWESFLIEAVLPHARKSLPVRPDRDGTFVGGISMGGFGSLKLALRHPQLFRAVAALEPAIQPGLRADQIGARNDYYFAGGPADLLPETRNPEVWEQHNPASIARLNAAAIQASEIAIFLECGTRDVLNLHDGAEFLHRVLWELDIEHEYRLHRGADHVGPSLAWRNLQALKWLLAVDEIDSAEGTTLTEDERAWIEWLRGGFEGDPPAAPLDAESVAAIEMLRTQFGPMREALAREDPAAARHFGKLPPPSSE